mmetsp:Transcript_23897/g.33431  ORF Transcript_23897/g.33431 Transcript_23897/m.33431 type:complete len:216 (-) Transcript_23897:306-953(-)
MFYGGEDEHGPAHLVKLVLIGDSGVGKTCILSRFVDNEFNDHFFSTIGVDFKARTLYVADQKVKVQIWDTAGQERFRTITSSYYRGAKGIMIVYNVADRESFENANNWLSEAEKFADPSIAKLLVGNKADLPRSQHKVSPADASEFAQKHNISWIETSAKEGTNVEEAFRAICAKVLKEQQTELSMDNSRGGTGASVRIDSSDDKKSNNSQNCCG